MLDLFAILTKGGIVLWDRSFAPISGNPLNALVKDVLIEERAGTASYAKDSYAFKWTFANEVDLVFVAAYQKNLYLTHVEELLETAKHLFIDTYATEIRDAEALHEFSPKFDDKFDRLLDRLEEKGQQVGEDRKRAPRPFEQTKKFQVTLEGSRKKPDVTSADSGGPGPNHQTTIEEEVAANIAALNARSPKMGGRGGATRKPTKKGTGKSTERKQRDCYLTRSSTHISFPAINLISSDNDDPTLTSKKRSKTPRTWEGQIARGEMERLDFSSEHAASSSPNNDDAALRAAEQLVDASKLGTKSDVGYMPQDLDDEEDDEEEEEVVKKGSGKQDEASGGVFSFFKSITGQKELTAKDLEPVMARMKEHLVNKNVAAEIAGTLCESVQRSLVGKKLGSFKSIHTTVKDSMEQALKRILTPKSSVDLLRDIEHTRSTQHRPYTLCFIGVNGVGKSTNLSKVCFWLLQNDLRVLIAACDTFRSGAVEQLRVHARNLKALVQAQGGKAEVELFERGYGKDSAGIAKDAISYAKANHFDVVLIDTAGRMQDNEPLMRALAKLVSVNSPDKVIFVGEALVGNEAVDQLTKFNQALKDFSGLQEPRHIDGMILTKFDTIDDKVGAALSMTYTTGQPILFVGTGQTYTDLKNMRVSHVVQSLLKE
ncbi:SRP54-type protein [Jimgerdemannia flammicorona]|uniref:SRP54-type protein n=1 Tax=Jimgerdemannia flammicorona TaxID=994334 RepID=A0A433D4D9_9FUNG|nr:SRP54-type protein [Jimgerdemannia flammicorona]